jgi:dCTP deaminase
MVLSGAKIREWISSGKIRTNGVDLHFGTNSVDVTLGKQFLLPVPCAGDVELGSGIFREYYSDTLVLPSGGFALGVAAEWFAISGPWAPMYEGRSTAARSGLFTHLSAGYGDVGFSGAFTLELYNASPNRLVLRAGTRIGQVSFVRVWGGVATPYNGVYNTPNIHGPKGIK